MARDYIAALPAALFPNMTALADEFAFASPDERFELLIDIFVDGLSRRAHAAGLWPADTGRRRLDGQQLAGS